jgi:phosphatidylinositol alpha-1,6-mannosyltransferase
MPKSRGSLVITELFMPTKGGTAIWFDEVYRRLGGKEIHILTADVPGAREVDRQHPNTVHRLKLIRHWWLKPESAAMYVKLLLSGLWIVLTQPIRVIHAGRVLPEGLVGWLIARITGKPVVIYAHGEEITTWLHTGKFQAMRFAYRHADRLVANSEFTREELLKLGVKAEKITLISPGVDVTRFKPGLPAMHLRASIGVSTEKKLILSVGRLSRRKGFDQVIQALPMLLERGIEVHYAIVGIGEDHDYLQSLARQYDVSQRVHLLGHVLPHELPLWYNACDVFAMPNRTIDGDTEGFGMVFLEAAACGKAAVAGNAGGTGAAVVDGMTGYRVRGEDPVQIADVLARLLREEDLRRRLSQAGHERALHDFSWDAVAAKTAPLLG